MFSKIKLIFVSKVLYRGSIDPRTVISMQDKPISLWYIYIRPCELDYLDRYWSDWYYMVHISFNFWDDRPKSSNEDLGLLNPWTDTEQAI